MLISAQALAETGLIRPGALVNYHYRLRLPPGVDAAAWGNSARAAFPEAGWQIRSFGEASPSLQRLIDRVGLFLSLVGLTALLVGGVGIGNAVGNYIAGKTATIATLKCLGASNRLVFGTVNASRAHFEMGRRDLEAVEELLPGWLERLITRRIPFTEATEALQKPPDDIKTVLTFD